MHLRDEEKCKSLFPNLLLHNDVILFLQIITYGDICDVKIVTIEKNENVDIVLIIIYVF